MEEKPSIQLSVHALVDFLLRKGDIDNRIYNEDTMKVGSLIHASFQAKQGKSYFSEVPLKWYFKRPLGNVTLEGRADGIIIGEKYPIIDEIKSTVTPIEEFHKVQEEWHLGQAKCYALLYALEHQEKIMGIRLTYISQLDQSSSRYEKKFTQDELLNDVNLLLDSYLAFYEERENHQLKRNQSISNLLFPFKKYRLGQRELASKVYKQVSNGGFLFAEAPTGIGKTMSVLFPSIKAFPTLKEGKIFYLTAKSSGQESARNALHLLLQKGLKARISELASKDKMCFSPGKNCNPDECPFAKKYFENLRSLIQKNIKDDVDYFDQEKIKELASSYAICPFELQLDLSLYSDFIVGDYNYFFDPIVKLERYFAEEEDASNHLLLIDESHNLVERSRAMYSASLSLKETKKVQKALRSKAPRTLIKSIGKLKKALEECFLSISLNEEYSDLPEPIFKALESLSNQHLKLLKDKHPSLPECYKELSRECHRFLFLYKNYGDYQTFYAEKHDDNLIFNAYCIDPSSLIAKSLSSIKGAIFFSATLSPISYYMKALTGEDKHPFILLSSPFPPENFRLLIAPHVSIKYKDRERTYPEVASYLKTFVTHKMGNYFIYFPSYEYLEKILPFLSFSDANTYIQKREMSDDERKKFLSHFASNPKKTSIGLLVIGGAFGEGIDLLADRLIGVAIVGIGLPQICFERNLLKNYYEENNGEGFAYAYLNPAVNKVMQAIGRLIRSETDQGSALLIDERYLNNAYRSIFARRYKGYEVVLNPDEITDLLA